MYWWYRIKWQFDDWRQWRKDAKKLRPLFEDHEEEMTIQERWLRKKTRRYVRTTLRRSYLRILSATEEEPIADKLLRDFGRLGKDGHDALLWEMINPSHFCSHKAEMFLLKLAGPEVIPKLTRLLEWCIEVPDQERWNTVRWGLAKALSHFGPSAAGAIEPLVRMLRREPGPGDFLNAQGALKHMGEAVIPAMLDCIRQQSGVEGAICVLGSVIQDASAIDTPVAKSIEEALLKLWRDPLYARNIDCNTDLLRLIVRLSPDNSTDALRDALVSGDTRLMSEAGSHLVALEKTKSHLIENLRSETESAVRQLVGLLMSDAGKDASPVEFGAESPKVARFRHLAKSQLAALHAIAEHSRNPVTRIRTLVAMACIDDDPRTHIRAALDVIIAAEPGQRGTGMAAALNYAVTHSAYSLHMQGQYAFADVGIREVEVLKALSQEECYHRISQSILENVELWTRGSDSEMSGRAELVHQGLEQSNSNK